MPPLSQGDARLLPLEGKRTSDTNAARIPEEYLQLLLPYAGIHSWQKDQVFILSQHVMLGPFSMWIHDLVAYRDQVICPFVPFPLYTLHFLFESSLDIRIPHSLPFRLEEDACNLFYLESGISHLELGAGSRALSIHLNILPHEIPQLTKDYPTLHQVLPDKPTGNLAINKHPYTINAVSRLLLSRMLTCRYLQQDANLYLERCCMDLFKIFCRQHAAEDRSVYVPDVMNHDVYDKIFEYLKSHPHVHYDIQRLSWMFEIPEPELEQGFQQTFALSIYEYIHMLKMMMVFDLLAQHSYTFGEIATAVSLDTERMISSVEAYYNFKIRVPKN